MQHSTHLFAVHALRGIHGHRVAPRVLRSFIDNTVPKNVTSTGTLLSTHTHVHVLNVSCTCAKRLETLMSMHFFRTPHFYTTAPARTQADLCAHNHTHRTPGTQSNGHNGEEREEARALSICCGHEGGCGGSATCMRGPRIFHRPS